MLILTNATVWNPGVLETGSLPKKFLCRVFIAPRTGNLRVWTRLLVELQVLRFTASLLPFALSPILVPGLAMPIMQAPVVMVMVVLFVELRVLRLNASARAAQIGPDEAARGLDTLSFRARSCLRRIAARHDLREGSLRLVIEQSELARIPPLTLVSVQGDAPRPHVLSLDPEDCAALEQGLFDDAFGERDLLAINHRDSVYIREVTQEARAVSAHARLAAVLERGATA